MTAAEKGLDTNATSMAVILELMKTLGLDTKAGQAMLVVATKDISSELISTGVLVGLMNRIMKKVTDWFAEMGPQIFGRLLNDPEPLVRLNTLGASSVDFVVRPWVKIDDYWDVYWDVTRTVKLRFDKEGISIPFPQRDVHVYNETPAAVSS